MAITLEANVETAISNTAFMPTKPAAKSKIFCPPIRPCIYSVLPKRIISDEVKRRVLRNAAEKPAMAEASGNFFDLSEKRKITPVKNPARTRESTR